MLSGTAGASATQHRSMQLGNDPRIHLTFLGQAVAVIHADDLSDLQVNLLDLPRSELKGAIPVGPRHLSSHPTAPSCKALPILSTTSGLRSARQRPIKPIAPQWIFGVNYSPQEPRDIQNL